MGGWAVEGMDGWRDAELLTVTTGGGIKHMALRVVHSPVGLKRGNRSPWGGAGVVMA
jgi:hypothetical protein